MEDFLSKNKGSLFPGIVITLDSLHALKVEGYLLSKNFKTDTDINNLTEEFRLGGNFYVTSEKIKDNISNFEAMHGFSSGQIQVGTNFISPKYESLNVVMILTRDFIENEQKEGRNWLTLGGLTIQPE